MIRNIEVRQAPRREDHYQGIHRVELHAHTIMSDMDGMNDPAQMVNTAADWGQPAVAITDHGVVQSFPDAFGAGQKRGIKVISYSTIEDVDLADNTYDIIYFNGSSSYISDLKPVYGKCKRALKEGGKLILLDVPKESAFGFMYLLGKSLNTYDHEYLSDAMPELPYPLALAASGVWHTTEEKIDILEDLGFANLSYYQTLIKNPLYTNEEPEEVSEGYKSGGYVAIVAEC
jgi:SAM-dependent methyltransferase